MNTDESLALEFSSIDDLIKHGFKNLVESIKHSNDLPSGINHDFYNTNASYNKLLMDEGGKILRLMNHILQSQDVHVSVFNRTNDERVELLVDANDEILEDVANLIDEYSGVKTKIEKMVEIETVSAKLSVNGSWNKINKNVVEVTCAPGMPQQESQSTYRSNTIHLISAKNIICPQKFFKDKVDNSNLYPWQPRITYKPNSVKQLSLYLEETTFGPIYSHPYEIELERFKPLSETLVKCNPIKFDAIEMTELIEVNTEEELNQMLTELQNATEIAVDLEHHSYRSFMGITCLMQISIPRKDYIVDTLVLRDKLWILNEVFTKESIVKIFHGADSDIQWLQRDLSLYIVNMFDTHVAAMLLNYPRRSLASLLARFCNFTPNKQFQLADWRMRPLPEELKHYARDDTHYLIYIYYMLRNELIDAANGDNNLLQAAFYQSKEICLKRYIKHICAEDSHLTFYRNCKRFFDNRQLFALKKLFNWRDNIAREEDESTGYILPNHMMLQICESLPREMQGIFACCNPIPPLLRANALEIHNFILKAREEPLIKAILKEDNRAKGSTSQFTRINMDGPLHCPHDIIKTAEFCTDLPTLLNNANFVPLESKLTDLEIEKPISNYSVFRAIGEHCLTSVANIMDKLKFLGPYERYKLVKPFVQAEQEKEQEKQKQQLEVVDKKDDPPVAERIALLKQECSRVVSLKTANITPNLSENKKRKQSIKSDQKREQHQSIRQQYPNTKRKRRPSFNVEETHSRNNDLTSTIPNFNSQNARKLRQESQEIESKCKKQRKDRNRNAQNRIDINSNKKDQEKKRTLVVLTPQPNKFKCRRSNRKNTPSNQLYEGRESFEPFDYSTVDFMRFGEIPSQSKSKQISVKSQFKGRGQGKTNFRGKNTNKSAAFFRNERK